jgi:hypothetical protein
MTHIRFTLPRLLKPGDVDPGKIEVAAPIDESDHGSKFMWRQAGWQTGVTLRRVTLIFVLQRIPCVRSPLLIPRQRRFRQSIWSAIHQSP